MEIRLDRISLEFKPACGTGNGVSCGLGGFRYIGGETREPGDFRRQIMGCDGAPGRIGALAARCCPKSLTFVEIPRRPGAEALRNEPRPVNPRNLCREIGYGW